MPISEKAQRAWKAGTAVITTWTAFYGLFYIDYGPHDHVFTDIQRWYRMKLDGLLGIDAKAAKQISNGRENKNNGGIPTVESDSQAQSAAGDINR
mmetsp:Transcript_5520/g.12598  ORF Transcript_5520/g.12598 Transcript_5520/m.12598 type:complete len:95 (-) Transcript_5520:338-622(-)